MSDRPLIGWDISTGSDFTAVVVWDRVTGNFRQATAGEIAELRWSGGRQGREVADAWQRSRNLSVKPV